MVLLAAAVWRKLVGVVLIVHGIRDVQPMPILAQQTIDGCVARDDQIRIAHIGFLFVESSSEKRAAEKLVIANRFLSQQIIQAGSEVSQEGN